MTVLTLWLVGTVGVASLPAQNAARPKENQLLFKAGSFPDGWFYYTADKGTKLTTTWQVLGEPGDKDAVLKCLGKPFGYIRTTKSYDNFEFGLEWKYPGDPNANSGILIYTGEDKIWPRAIQIQLHRPMAGSIFPSGDAETDANVRVEDLNLPVNRWHRCVVTSRDGTVSVQINGRKIGEVTGCNPKKGHIALQSEGSEIHFRHIWIHELN